MGHYLIKNLGISVTNGNFIETEIKPWDGTIVDYTYKYVNKSGGPDRRFANNPRYPIMSYSYINFYGDNGFDECIMLSKQGVGNILKEQIKVLQSQEILKKDNNINDNKIDKLNDINEVINNIEKLKNEEINIKIENGNENISAEYENNEADPCLMEAIDIVIETGQASTSFIQRRLKVGYARAGRIIDQMEERGIISEYQGSKPREVLMTKERWMQLKNNDIKIKKVDNSAVEQTKEEKKEDIEEKIEIKDKRKNMFYKK